MRRVIALSAVVATVLGLLVVPAAAVSTPLRVTIEDTAQIAAGTGDFVATGQAVAAGVMCSSGTTAVTSSTRTDLSPNWALLRIRKIAECDDGSGMFNIRMNVLLNVSTGETFALWRFRAGTGSYTSLAGVGVLVGTPIVQGVSVLDVYRGRVRA